MRAWIIITVLIILSTVTTISQPVFDRDRNIISIGGPPAAVTFPPEPIVGGQLLPAEQGIAWLPMGPMPGIAGQVMRALVFKDELYVLHEVLTPQLSSYCIISKWNGSEWEKITEISSNGRDVLFTEYKGKLYTYGAIGDRYLYIYSYDGSKWEKLLSTANSIFEGIEYQGELYVSGTLSSPMSGVPNVKGIVRWDGSQWRAVGGGLLNTDGVGTDRKNEQVASLAEYKGKLYAGGSFSHAGTLRTPYLAVWNGTSWEAGPHTPTSGIEEMWVDNGLLYLYAASRGSSWKGQVSTWDGTTWRDLPAHPLTWVGDIRTFKGDLYICGRAEDRGAIARWDGASWTLYQGFDPRVTSFSTWDSVSRAGYMIEYQGSLIIGGRFAGFAGTRLDNIARMCNEGECGSLSGNVYLDKDDNCIRDNNDSALSRRLVKIEPGPIYITSDAEGRYKQPVIPGDYTVSILPPQHWNQTCPAAPGTHQASITGGNEHAGDLDFAMKGVPNVRDLRVSITAGLARPGRQLDYFIMYENAGTTTIDGSITFTYDPRLTVAGTSPLIDRDGTAMLGWDFTGLRPEESRTIRVTLNLPASLQMNEVLCAYVSVDIAAVPDLSFNSDDRDTVCVTVRNSYDPNDISVRPNGLEENGEITPEDSVLHYTIRFQNTGNDTAFRIVVADTLPPYLDPATVRPGSASHRYDLNISGSGILTWTFDNIYLPDSTTNETASHGVVKYSVHMRPRLPVGTIIPNRVQIYFDYNAPVATNTVFSIITAPLGVESEHAAGDATVTPNPSTGVVRIDARMRRGADIAVLDLLGRRMLSVPVRNEESQATDLSSLPAGVYLLALPTMKGTTVRQVMVMK